MELHVQNLDAVLSSANSKARSMDKVQSDDRSIVDIPQTRGNLQIYIYNAQLSLHAASDLNIERLREGHAFHDLDEKARQGVSRPNTTHKSDEGKIFWLTLPTHPTLMTVKNQESVFLICHDTSHSIRLHWKLIWSAALHFLWSDSLK